MEIKSLILNNKDNVAVVLDAAKPCDVIAYSLPNEEEKNITAATEVPIYHKVAITDIAQGQLVYKYGQVIGRATSEIKVGQHVHTHNVTSIREEI